MGLMHKYQQSLMFNQGLDSGAAGLDGMRGNNRVAYLTHFQKNGGPWFHVVA